MIGCKSVFSGLLIALSLVSCGGEEPTPNAEPKEIEFSGPPIVNNREIEVADIVGVWAIEATVYGPENEHWATDNYNLVITEDGRFMDFDDKDDSLAVNQGEAENCYVLRNDGNISKLADGGFAVDFGLGSHLGVRIYVNYDIENDRLVAPEHYLFSDSEIISAERAGVTIASMESMFCES